MTSTTGIESRVVLVTGGGSGIGRAAAMAFAAKGAKVVIGNRNQEAGLAVVAEIEAAGGTALFQTTDVGNETDVKRLVEMAVDSFGQLDFAFNNAGFVDPVGPLHMADSEAVEALFRVNFMGVFYSMKHEITAMLANTADSAGAGRGAIVNCSSVFGLAGFKSLSPYSASKHAVTGLTRAAALDYAQEGIRINAVAPGPIETPALGPTPDIYAAYVPMGRLGQPGEIAHAVVWLCSDEASYITGHVMALDGGAMASCDPGDSVGRAFAEASGED